MTPEAQTTVSEEPSSRAVASLVLGILAITGFCPCIGGVLAILFGSGERGGLARAGVILGWIHLVMMLAGVILFLALGGLAMLGAAIENM